MENRISYLRHLLIPFWAVLLLALLLPARCHYQSLRDEMRAEAQKKAVQQLHLAHWMLNIMGDVKDAEDLQDRLIAIGRQMNVRVTYMAEGGRIIADSNVPFSEIGNMENHASRPEIMQARTQEIGMIIRFSRVSQKEQIYVAKSVTGWSPVPSGVLRLAIPWSPVKERFEDLSKSLLLFILVTFFGVASLSYILARRLDRPISTILHTLEAIGNGSYKQRIHFHHRQPFYPMAQAINQMAQHIEAHIQPIVDQKQRLQAVFDGMQEGVMVLDSRGKILNVNRALSRIFPNVTQSIGRRPLQVIMSLELQVACDRVLSSGSGLATAPHNLQIALSEDQIYDVNIVGLQDEQRGMGAIVVFHDISELKRLEKVRRDFVENVSHELRTPLTSIKGYAETLLTEGADDPLTRSSFLQVILRNTNHMVKMVDDLLQLARLEAHQKPITLLPANASEVLSAAWKACAPLADAKGIRLESHFPEEGTEPSVLVDFDQLVQVFRNLLENAIRYSPLGEAITVSYALEQDGTVRFSVHDEGPGIPRQHQHRIFERFYRVEKHRSGESGSTGLGLAICRHIIRNHGGRIWVKSPDGSGTKGTTFFFTLFHASRADDKPGGNVEVPSVS